MLDPDNVDNSEAEAEAYNTASDETISEALGNDEQSSLDTAQFYADYYNN